MPLDGKDALALMVPQMKQGHQRLYELARALRHEEEWKDRFAWDFNVCFRDQTKTLAKQMLGDWVCDSAGCAIGLAHTLWPDKILLVPLSWDSSAYLAAGDSVEQFFETDEETACTFFDQEKYAMPAHDVKPSHVAERIEEFLTMCYL